MTLVWAFHLIQRLLFKDVQPGCNLHVSLFRYGYQTQLAKEVRISSTARNCGVGWDGIMEDLRQKRMCVEPLPTAQQKKNATFMSIWIYVCIYKDMCIYL